MQAPQPNPKHRHRSHSPAQHESGQDAGKCRKRPTKAIKHRLLEEQAYRCFACAVALRTVEYDHVIPLGLGGSNASDNWAALCPACHLSKTRQDLRLIAKAKRRKRYQETGRSHAPNAGGNWRTGFDKSLKKRLNGMVEKTCRCRACRQPRTSQ